MAFNIDRIDKSMRTVIKFIRKNPRTPDSRAVHKVRTSARHLEVALSILDFQSKGNRKQSLNQLAEVRKLAGKVRDMDVLTAQTLMIQPGIEEDCVVELLEYLGARRKERARKLYSAIEGAKSLRRHLEKDRIQIAKDLRKREGRRVLTSSKPRAIAKIIQGSIELRVPARLHRKNLHEFRIKVKELGDVLQLFNEAGHADLRKKLRKVKDSIGEWHDLEVLQIIAGKVIKDSSSCPWISQLKRTSKSRYVHALSLANNLRRHILRTDARIVNAATAIARDL